MRGLKPMYYQLPFALCKNNDEMEAAIKNFNMADYSKKLQKFYKVYGSVDDGYASKRVVEHLKQMIQ